MTLCCKWWGTKTSYKGITDDKHTATGIHQLDELYIKSCSLQSWWVATVHQFFNLFLQSSMRLGVGSITVNSHHLHWCSLQLSALNNPFSSKKEDSSNSRHGWTFLSDCQSENNNKLSATANQGHPKHKDLQWKPYKESTALNDPSRKPNSPRACSST